MKYILLFLFFFTITYAGAQTLVLTNDTPANDVSKYIQYTIDSISNIHIDQIKEASTRWQTFMHGQIPNMGVKKQPCWFTFTLQNKSDITDWILYVDYRTLDLVTVWIYDLNGVLLFSGTQGILTPNLHKQRMPFYPVTFRQNEPVRVYMRVQTSSLLVFPVMISTPMAFCKSENEQRDVYLPALGILLAAFLFNLVLLISSREKAFLFLLLSIASEICFVCAVVGFFYEHIHFDPPILLQKLRFIFVGLSYGFHTLFTVYYLNLKSNKTIWRIEAGAITCLFLYSFLAGSGILSPWLSGVFLVPINILFFIIQFAIACWVTLKKIPMARYYLFSFIPILLAMVLYIAIYNSWIVVGLFFSNSGLYASALFTILLTFGLTEKMIKVKHETARANQLEIDKMALEAEINQRIKAERNLQESETRFHQLFELSPLPVLLSEFESGKIVDSNFSLSEFTGLQKEAFKGKTWFDLGYIDVKKREELNQVISQEEHLLAYEASMLIKGKLRIVHFFMSVVNIGSKKFLITLISDVTNQKEAEKKLKELNHTKDKFFSIIAHDLINPFHAMILYSKELKTFTQGNARAELYNANLLLTAQNTFDLLQNLLTWARTQNKQVSFNPQTINLGSIIADVVDFAMNTAKTKQIEIVNEAQNEILFNADVQMISFILRNLISNSIKFSFNQGVVKVSSKEDEYTVSISVTDHGTGMETHEVDKLFDLYRTSQHQGTAGESGTGLGLVICNEFVNSHGGTIHVVSEHGKGSTFYIVIPKNQK